MTLPSSPDVGAAPAPSLSSGPPPRPRFRPARRARAAKVGVAVLLVAGLGALGFFRLRPLSVSATAVVRGSAIDAVYATATVEAEDRVTVRAKVAGAIAELVVHEGDAVEQGAMLAVVDSPALRFQLERGKADQWAAGKQASATSPQLGALDAQARATETSLALARDERARLARLVASGAVATAELDRAASQVAVLEAQLASQRAQVAAARIDLQARATGSTAAVSELAARLADAEVRSPIRGTVLDRAVEPGEVVMVNAPLFKIGDVGKLVLECSVDEADIGRIDVGKKAAVSLYAFPKQVFDGTVFEIAPDADRAKKAFVVKVRLTEPPRGLRSGMSGEVNVLVETHEGALLAPSDAVAADGTAWVVRDGKVEPRSVQIGIRDMLRVEVLSGLAEHELVVVGGGAGLRPGARVTATEVAPPAAAPVAAPRGKVGL